MMEMNANPEQVRWFRLKRSGLLNPFASMTEATQALMGVQAQILPAAGVSLWNRTTEATTYNQVLSALFEDKNLVKLWGQRGTLHLYDSQDWPLVYSGFTDRRSWWEHKTVKEGGDLEEFRRTVRQLADLLAEKTSLTRTDLRESDIPLNQFLLSSWGGIFHELVRGGHACHGPSRGNEGSFVHRESWIPDLEWEPVPSMEAHKEWSRRYIRAYGPASLQDLAYWRGVPMRDVKQWTQQWEEPLVQVQVEGEDLLLHEDDVDELLETPPPAKDWPLLMLYRFDPLLLAHPDKSWLLDLTYKANVWRKAGHIEGTLLKHGRIIGTWKYKRQSGSFRVLAEPFTRFTKREVQFLQKRGTELAEFFEAEWGGLDVEETS